MGLVNVSRSLAVYAHDPIRATRPWRRRGSPAGRRGVRLARIEPGVEKRAHKVVGKLHRTRFPPAPQGRAMTGSGDRARGGRQGNHSVTSPFTRKALAFLRALQRNNEREWFRARQADDEAHVRAPMIETLEWLARDLPAFAPDLVSAPKVSLFRIYRDTRFSANKAPLKTNVAAYFPPRGCRGTRRPYAVVRRTRRRGGAVCGLARARAPAGRLSGPTGRVGHTPERAVRLRLRAFRRDAALVHGSSAWRPWASVEVLAVLRARGARSRYEVEGSTEVQDEIPRRELAGIRPSAGPARQRDAVAVCRCAGRVATVAVWSTGRAAVVLGSRGGCQKFCV